MRALLFEVLPRPDHEGHYFDRAAVLKPILERHAGLLFLDRYRSQSRPGLILSHSLWQDEAALVSWRRDPTHKQAQAAGRTEHFADYRIRISTVLQHVRSDSTTADSWPDMPNTGPLDEGASRLIIVSSHGVSYKGEGEVFASINNAGSNLTVFEVATETQGKQAVMAATANEYVTDVKYCRVCRDYGMFERAQAPREFLSQTAESR